METMKTKESLYKKRNWLVKRLDLNRKSLELMNLKKENMAKQIEETERRVWELRVELKELNQFIYKIEHDADRVIK